MNTVMQKKAKPMDVTRVLVSLKNIILYSALIIASLTMLLPFFWMLSASLKPETEVFLMPIQWIPSRPLWTNYVEIWQRIPFARYYLNTVILTVSVTLLQILTSSLAAYAFAKISFKERDILFFAYLGTLMVPFTVIMIPQFIIIRNLGLINDLRALILIGAFNPFGVFLFRQFFLTIPEELSEAARIDGCSELGIYSRIIMPNSKPAIGSLTIFTFVFVWNDFLGPLIYLSDERVKTIQLGIRNFQTQYSQDFALLMAAAVVALLPVIILFVLAQEFFVKGVTMDGIKG